MFGSILDVESEVAAKIEASAVFKHLSRCWINWFQMNDLAYLRLWLSPGTHTGPTLSYLVDKCCLKIQEKQVQDEKTWPKACELI